MVGPYLNRVGGEVEDDVSTFAGGLNTYVDKAFLESDQMPFCMNIKMKRPPSIETRASRETLATEIQGGTIPWNQGKIIRVWAYNQDYIYFIIKENGSSDYKVVLLKKTTSFPIEYTYTVLKTESSQYIKDAYFCYARTGSEHYVYISGEDYKARTILGSADPNDYTTYQDHFGIPAWHKCRLFLLRPSDGVVEWSNSFMPDDFTPGPSGDSGELPITSTRGSLTALASFDDKLIVFCEHSMHAIYGNSGIATDADYFQVVDLLGTLGCFKQDHVAVTAGDLFWLGDDNEIYNYTGASIHMISRPSKTRNETLSIGGVSGIIGNTTQLAANSNTLYVNTNSPYGNWKYLLVFDTFNRTWWAEDSNFVAIGSFSAENDDLLLATEEGDILNYRLGMNTGYDIVYDWETGEEINKNITYEFHTRVYGADGTDLRESLADIWLQCSATAEAYITDEWTHSDRWGNIEPVDDRWVKIGDTIEVTGLGDISQYNSGSYEQQRCIVPKMYGQRLNTFQVIVKGTGYGKFYLMKRKWRAR